MSTQNFPNAGNQTPVTARAKQTTADLAEQTKTAASNIAQDAATAAANQADAAKSAVADKVSGVASALRTAAKDMRSGSTQERTVGQIA